MPEASAKKPSKSAAKVKTEKVVESADKEKKVVKQKRRQKRPYGRLYARAVFTGFRRGLRNQHENTALLKVDGCDSKSDSWFYVGKRVAYVYRVCVNRVPIVSYVNPLKLVRVTYVSQCSIHYFVVKIFINGRPTSSYNS